MLYNQILSSAVKKCKRSRLPGSASFLGNFVPVGAASAVPTGEKAPEPPQSGGNGLGLVKGVISDRFNNGVFLKVSESYCKISPAKCFSRAGKPGRRHGVSGMSDSSARRMRQKLASVDLSQYSGRKTARYCSGFFCAFTLPALWQVPYNPDFMTSAAKIYFQTFLKRFFRKFGNVGVIWRVEFTEENGTPHFHAIFLFPFKHDVKKIRTFCLGNWADVVGYGGGLAVAGTRCDVLWGSQGRLRSYLTGYVADRKSKQNRRDIQTGRVWGIYNPASIAFHKFNQYFLDSGDYAAFLRRWRRYTGYRVFVGGGRFYTTSNTPWFQLLRGFQCYELDFLNQFYLDKLSPVSIS